MAFRPFFAAHKGIHARITGLAATGNTNGLVRHPLGLQGGRNGLLRLMAFTAINLAFRTRMLVSGVLLFQEGT